MQFFTTEDFMDFMRREVKDAVEQAFIAREELKRFKLSEHTKYLTRHQVADYLGIALSTVDLWARTGKLEKRFIDRSPRFDRDAIDRNLSLRKRPPRAA